MEKEIYNLILNLRNLQKQNFQILKQEVDYIIINKIVDKNKIEKLLDNLLSVCYSDEVINYYNKLCNYYSNIDKKASNFYKKELKKIL